MTKKQNEKDFPIAHAVPISDVYFVDLPVRSADLKFEVEGCPPQISIVHKDCPVADQLPEGHYIHGVILPEIEIVSLTDPVHLQNLIEANTSNPRRLMVSSSPFYVDSTVENRNNTDAVRGALYKHTLPASSSLGFGMRGFPPVITVVAPTSPLSGRLHPGQTVEALLVPGQPIFNLGAGGFTSARVEERLFDTCEIPRRTLVVKDGHDDKAGKGSSRALDDCAIS